MLALGVAVSSPGVRAQEPRPRIETRNLPDGVLGFHYKAILTASRGTPPYVWSATGALPPGLLLKPNKGKVVGTPTAVGTFPFTLRVRDAAGQTRERDLTIAIGTPTPVLELASVSSDGVIGNAESGTPAISGDGRFVVFTSFATNLDPTDTNNSPDVFLRDRVCGVTLLVSVGVDSSGNLIQGGSQSFAPAVSSLVGDTLFVAYVSDSNNLVPDDTNNVRDVFSTVVRVADCVLTPVSTARVSVASDGTEGNAFSTLPTLSANGAHVAYHSLASTLVEADTNNTNDAFVTDLEFTDGVLRPVRTRRVSIMRVSLGVLPLAVPDTMADIFSDNTIGSATLSMTEGEHVGQRVEIVAGTGQGQARTVTANDATTLTVSPNWNPVPTATSVFHVVRLEASNQAADIFSENTIGSSGLAMRNDEHINRVVEIVAGTGTGQARAIKDNDATTLTVDPDWDTVPDDTSRFRVLQEGATNSFRGRLTPDGAFVGFNTVSNFGVSEDNNAGDDVFLHDPANGVTTRVSLSTDGATSNGSSIISALSAAGNLVLFHSTASNLVADDTNKVNDLFVRDRLLPETTRISVATDGTEADANADVVAGLSGSGRLVAFDSFASNLVADDRNGARDVFLHDRQTAETRRLSVGLGGINPNGESFDAAISLDGTTVAFTSTALNLLCDAGCIAFGDTNEVGDVFVAATGVTESPVVAVGRLAAPRPGAFYSAPLLAVGGRQPYFWTLEEGRLPPGLFLDPTTGVISGTPQREGEYRFTVLVLDADRP
ncbi:MAG: putative Ig domain-containing protein, partial [Acidobacteria bacterium]|nr:putative Ig domain-containing protein [Acidobacteriota bacterium]